MSGENFSPHFSVDYSGEEFASRDEREAFGYEPFDVYLKSDLSTLDQHWIGLGAETPSEFLEKFDSEYLLVFRYKHENVKVSRTDTLDSVDQMPDFQHEVIPVRTVPNGDLTELAKELENGLDNSNTLYFRRIEASERQTTVEGFVEETCSNPINIFPTAEGISEIDLRPQKMEARIAQYSRRLKVPKSEEGFTDPFAGDHGDEYREVKFDYSEGKVEETIEAIDSIGFDPYVEILPPTVSPHHI